MSSLISRYYESLSPRKGSPARKRIAGLLQKKRALQKKGEGPNVRASLLAHVAKKTAIRRKNTMRDVAAETADMRKRFKKTFHQITANPRTKKPLKAAVRTKSFSATASARPRGKKANLLQNHVHYA